MKIKNFTLALTFIAIATQVHSQITVGLSTLPEAGDVLNYDTFDSYNGEGYDMIGEDMTWDFSDLLVSGASQESYLEASAGTAADSFPTADLLVEFIGNEGYALRNSTSISVIGFSGEEFGGLPIPLTIELDQPFAIRRAPMAFGDVYNTQTNFAAKFPLSDFPALDTLISENNPLGDGVEIDSFAVNWDLSRTEEAVGWGNVIIGDNEVEVLQVLQTDNVETAIEAFIISPLGGTWLDVSGFLPEEFAGQLSINTNTYKYLTEEDKTVYVEFVVNQNLGEAAATGRTKENLVSTSTENVVFSKDILLYPNPANQYLTISSSNHEAIQSVEIFDIKGQLLMSVKPNIDQYSVDVSHLENAHYFVKIRTEKEYASQRFTIAK